VVKRTVFGKFSLMIEPASSATLEPVDDTTGHAQTWNEWGERLLELFGNAIVALAGLREFDEHSAEDVLQGVVTTLIRAQHGELACYRSEGNYQQGFWVVIRHRPA
jgi:hypothetical protein